MVMLPNVHLPSAPDLGVVGTTSPRNFVTRTSGSTVWRPNATPRASTPPLVPPGLTQSAIQQNVVDVTGLLRAVVDGRTPAAEFARSVQRARS